MQVGTNILIHPDTTGPGKFGRRLAAALLDCGIVLRPGPGLGDSVFLASGMLHPHEYSFHRHLKIVHRIDNTGELYPWDGTQWTADTEHIRYTYKNAHTHIFQTEWSARQFAACPELYVDTKDYTVTFNGVPLRPLDDSVKGNGILCSICNTWSMTRLYGFDKYLLPHLRQIFTDIPEFKWMVVGKVEPLLSALAEHGLSEFIGSRILPYQFPADLDKVRKASDGFIHLLCHDSCPNSVVESVMYSLPGITLDTGAAELIGDGSMSFSEPTAEDLTQAIQSILCENKERRILTYQYAAKHLDITKVAERYANVITSAA